MLNRVLILKKVIFILVFLIFMNCIILNVSGFNPNGNLELNNDTYDIYVDDDWKDQDDVNDFNGNLVWNINAFDSIEDSMESITANNLKIFVFNGIYEESIEILYDNTYISGESKSDTIIKSKEGSSTNIVNVGCSNIIINNFTIDGNLNEIHGIMIDDNDFLTISNCIIKNCSGGGVGVYASDFNGIDIKNCEIIDNGYGIHFNSGSNDHLSMINIFNCLIEGNRNIGINCYSSEEFEDEDNRIVNTRCLSNGQGGIKLDKCENFIIDNCVLNFNNKGGMTFEGLSRNNQIINSDVKYNSECGISLFSSNLNSIINCNVSNNGENGVYLEDSSNNNIDACNITKNVNNGILIKISSDSNDIKNCDITENNENGLLLSSSSQNEIFCCIFEENQEYCIRIKKVFIDILNLNGLSILNKITGIINEFLFGGNGNYLYGNIFIADSERYMADDHCRNFWWKEDFECKRWNFPVANVGNFWQNYSDIGADINRDDIIDNPYPIDGRLIFKNEDIYPLKYNPLIDDWNPPDVSIIYPNGGEHLCNNVNIKWSAKDVTSNLCKQKCEDDDINITIEIYNNSGWEPFPNAIDLKNIEPYSYTWDTTKCRDKCNYRIRIKAVDNSIAKNIAYDESAGFLIINNDGPYVSQVIITNTKNDSSMFVKDNDEIAISADIICGSIDTNNLTIAADLSGFGESSSALPIDFNGIYNGVTANWYIPRIKCNTDNGFIWVNVTVSDKKDIISINSGYIIADNTKPQVFIDSPVNGLYLFGKHIFIPLVSDLIESSIVLGNVFINATVMDNFGIDRMIWVVDGELKEEYNDMSEWLFTNSFGKHTVKLIVYDHAQNINSNSVTFWYIGR